VSQRKKTKDQLRVDKAQKEKPPLSRILNLKEMEVRTDFLCPNLIDNFDHLHLKYVASQVLSHKARAYYASASDDEICTPLTLPPH
jgi:L-lactate dehydrogenase (cytochrome)